MGHLSTVKRLEATNAADAMKEGREFGRDFASDNADPWENPTGEYRPCSFEYFDEIFDTPDDFSSFAAFEYYKDGVARVRRPPKGARARLDRATEKAQTMRNAADDALREAVEERKSKTITCKCCDSRYDKKWLLKSHRLLCPVCGERHTTETHESRIRRAGEIEDAAKDAYDRACAESEEYDFYVKVEVHV